MILVARIKQIVEGLIEYVQNDFETIPEEETLLYLMFFGLKDGQFDFYEQAKKIFLRKKTSPRKITVSLEYPKDKNHFPCVVIRDPNRNETSTPLGGFAVDPYDNFGGQNFEREGFVSFISSKVHMMCFSDNVLESILIGEVLFTLLRGARNTFEEEFYNFSFSMSELIAENPLFPTPILIKNIEIEIQDGDRFGSIIRPEMVKRFIIDPAIPIES